MATTVDRITAWLRDLRQVRHNEETVGAFVCPADLLIDDDGVAAHDGRQEAGPTA